MHCPGCPDFIILGFALQLCYCLPSDHSNDNAFWTAFIGKVMPFLVLLSHVDEFYLICSFV